ncbi:Hypothetical protein FKW44_005124 [Caligus rogercresseyi]|uniref:Uncharacterized protein n=1 Tax=Caligus rogercresseyi TaxID=217165 RepID=A0A7T8QRQ3_CALRO|nr:Hypothetical protein FKW44_005124 [Caligus rogercresseyi]
MRPRRPPGSSMVSLRVSTEHLPRSRLLRRVRLQCQGSRGRHFRSPPCCRKYFGPKWEERYQIHQTTEL